VKPLLLNIRSRKFILLAGSILLFLLSFLFSKLYTRNSSLSSEVEKAEEYIQGHQEDFNRFLLDTTRIRKLLKRTESLGEFNNLVDKKYGTYLYTINEYGDSDLRFWSDQVAVPPPQMLYAQDGEYFLRLSNGWYFTIKKTLSDTTTIQRVLGFAMIPVRSKFFIETDYLPEQFHYSPNADKRVRLSEKPTEFAVKSLTGKTVFFLERKTSVAVPYNDTLTVVLRLTAVLLLMLFLHLFGETLSNSKGAWKGIAFLALSLLVLRLATYFYPSILNLRQFDLFNPVHYGSNAIQRSLGDLLINAALFSWVVLFAWPRIKKVDDPLGSQYPRLKWLAGIVAIILLIYSTFTLATVIRSLVADSKISFDVSNFFTLTRYTVVGFAILACLSLSYYYFSQILFKFIYPLFRERKILTYFAIGLAGLIFLTWRSGDGVLFYIPVLVWLLAYTWLIERQGLLFSRIRINIASILSWIFVFSISISLVMLSEISKAEWEKRKRMADKLAFQTDQGSELLMSIAINYIDNDFLNDNFSRFFDEIQNRQLRDSIITTNYTGYLNKYDTRLYIYDKDNIPLFNDDAISFEALNAILEVQSTETSVEGLFYYETSFDRFNYITRRQVVAADSSRVGTLFIVSNPKNYSSDALFPELFRQFKQADPESSPLYSHAVYQNRQLMSDMDKYPFPTMLVESEMPKQEFERRQSGEYDQLWYKSDNKVVVIVRKKDTLIEAITLFSYLFCAFLFLVALVQMISFVLKTGTHWKGFRRLFQLNIRSQVHSTIIFISIFSFLVIGASTISFFISRYERNNRDKLSRTMKIMVNEMQKRISEQKTFDDVIRIYDTVSNKGLQQLVDEVSDIHGVDVNVYGLEGDLYVSSESNVYNKGVLSKKMEPTAYYHLARLRHVLFDQTERIGKFSYMSMYAPVRDDGGVYAYLNIPYFTSRPELEQEISNFLVTIINLNAFIFLVAGLIALFITNRITHSFSVISDKMKEVNLGRQNEEIEWNREDEIGDLVKEYNKMVAKLGESAIALAKSEREGAWREMARQVAHEIKNPLTPMKLSIQYLQKAIANNQSNVKELSASVATTLVEQIDHLSKIAADFSQFANIGYTRVEKFDLHDVINSLTDLYKPNENVQIRYRPVLDSVIVEADKTQMNRMFTNLLTNALEACNGRDVCRVDIDEQKDDNNIRVSIRDNGEGIPAEMQDKIFTPNFTTKSSGTGLGLAMVKGIVEQARGKIWFETGGNGTTFYVEIPLENTK
jgi:two-component system, NtrC family, nitrogen regulation sensor histidine kinase NtrY